MLVRRWAMEINLPQKKAGMWRQTEYVSGNATELLKLTMPGNMDGLSAGRTEVVLLHLMERIQGSTMCKWHCLIWKFKVLQDYAIVEHAAYVTALHVYKFLLRRVWLFNTNTDSLGRIANSGAHTDMFKHVVVNAMLSYSDRSVTLV